MPTSIKEFHDNVIHCLPDMSEEEMAFWNLNKHLLRIRLADLPNLPLLLMFFPEPVQPAHMVREHVAHIVNEAMMECGDIQIVGPRKCDLVITASTEYASETFRDGKTHIILVVESTNAHKVKQLMKKKHIHVVTIDKLGKNLPNLLHQFTLAHHAH